MEIFSINEHYQEDPVLPLQNCIGTEERGFVAFTNGKEITIAKYDSIQAAKEETHYFAKTPRPIILKMSIIIVNMSKMKIIFGWKLTETYLCGKFVELEIIRKRPVKRRSFSIILIKSDSRRIIMDICIFIMAVFAVGSYIYKQFL